MLSHNEIKPHESVKLMNNLATEPFTRRLCRTLLYGKLKNNKHNNNASTLNYNQYDYTICRDENNNVKVVKITVVANPLYNVTVPPKITNIVNSKNNFNKLTRKKIL